MSFNLKKLKRLIVYKRFFLVKMKNLFLQCTVPYNDIYNLLRQIIDNMVLSGMLYCLHITMATLKTGLIKWSVAMVTYSICNKLNSVTN